MEKVKELFASRKFIVTMLGIISITVLASIGKVSGEDALNFAKWVLGSWVLAQAGVDATKTLRSD